MCYLLLNWNNSICVNCENALAITFKVKMKGFYETR